MGACATAPKEIEYKNPNGSKNEQSDSKSIDGAINDNINTSSVFSNSNQSQNTTGFATDSKEEKKQLNVDIDDFPEDLSAFEQYLNLEPCHDSTYKMCPAIKRILYCLKYYKSLNITNVPQNKAKFEEFMHQTYNTKIIDDFYHLCQCHQHELQAVEQYGIDNGLTECDLAICMFAGRHYRANDNHGKDDKTENNVYFDIIDSLHFYIHHLYQTSFRFLANTPNDNDYIEAEDDEKNNAPYFDRDFARIHENIKKARATTQRFARMAQNQTKFAIKTDDQHGDNLAEDHESGSTYLDGVFEQLLLQNVDDHCIAKLKAYIMEEKYDTESLDMDIEIKSGNISNHIQNQQCMDAIIAMFKDSRCM